MKTMYKLNYMSILLKYHKNQPIQFYNLLMNMFLHKNYDDNKIQLLYSYVPKQSLKL
jgi:hypothetical protein